MFVSARLEPVAVSGSNRKPGEQRVLLSVAAENTNGTAFSMRADTIHVNSKRHILLLSHQRKRWFFFAHERIARQALRVPKNGNCGHLRAV